jgi:putative (di)nucleoside polyphosphate hydrolase
VKTAEPEFAEWRWLDIQILPKLVVPFKRDTYAKVIAAFQDLATPA